MLTSSGRLIIHRSQFLPTGLQSLSCVADLYAGGRLPGMAPYPKIKQMDKKSPLMFESSLMVKTDRSLQFCPFQFVFTEDVEMSRVWS